MLNNVLRSVFTITWTEISKIKSIWSTTERYQKEIQGNPTIQLICFFVLFSILNFLEFLQINVKWLGGKIHFKYKFLEFKQEVFYLKKFAWAAGLIARVGLEKIRDGCRRQKIWAEPVSKLITIRSRRSGTVSTDRPKIRCGPSGKEE